MNDWRPALIVRDESFHCGHCGEEISPVAVNWKDHAHHWHGDLAATLGAVGVIVKQRAERPLVLHTWSCPACATFLETNLYPDDMEPLHDVRLGAGAPVPEGARPV